MAGGPVPIARDRAIHCFLPGSCVWIRATIPFRVIREIDQDKNGRASMRPSWGGVMLRVRSPQDLGAGMVLILIGAAGLIFGQDLRIGTAARMGPGYFPLILSILIGLLGLIIGARGFTIDGPPVDKFHLRPIFFILLAIVASGYLMNLVGLALTAIIVTLLAAYARPQVDLRETLLLGAGLALFTVLVFVYALGQPLPAWWGR
jgi:hypothetical protein